LAVAGGVRLILYPGLLIGAHGLGVLSPVGRCKTFDAGANGYVNGVGVGAVLLKPLEKAVADGDHIHAVIRGTATNHGGTAASLTAPNSDAQAELLAAAFDDAGIDPESLTYMELHGTGTELGDPVEVDGVQKAFSLAAARRGRSPARRRSCGMGSVKTHIGHLEPAAGIAGLIKVVLCLQHRTLTGTLHLKKRNPYIRIEDSPLYIVEENRPWHPGMDERGKPIPRRAGVSSFGFGGTNAHVVVEEFEDPKSVDPPPSAGAGRGGSPQLFVLSAKSEERLKTYAGLFAESLRGVPVIPQNHGTEAVGADVLGALSGICGKLLGVAAGELDPDESFAAMGMDPLGVSALSKAASERYDIDVTAVTLTEYATLRRVALHIGEKIRSRGPHPRPERPRRNPPVESIAYTLQTGREPMEFRLATVADDLDDLREKWGRFAAGDDLGDGTFTGRVDTRKTASRKTPAMERDLARVEALRPGDWVEAAKLWIQGYEPDWRRLHQDQAVGRVPLPTYPFARERYWIPEKETRVTPEMSTRFFRPKWRKAEFPQGSPSPAISDRRIVFMDPDGIGPGPDRSMPGMEAVGKDALWIQYGPSFRFDGSVACTIDPLRGDDYRKLLAEMKDLSGPMSIVLLRKPAPFHSGTGEVQSRIEALLYPVFYFCRSLMERSIGRDIRIICFSVVPPDQTDPLHTALGGFLRTLSLEHPGFHGKTVLLEDAEHLPAIMAREMAACESQEIRYRNGERCARELNPIRMEPASPTESPFKAGGVYLLAGGAGGLGFLFARHLAARAKAKLVLCGRSEPKREWMERIRRLKEMGSDAVYLQADLGRSEAVSALVSDIRSRFGPINGVVHFAGVTRDAYILKKTSGEIAAVLAPKVFGTVHLDAATRGEPLDFFALFSSTAAIFGNAGQSDYAFANGFMDGFAQWRESVRKQNRRSGRTVSINWPLWKDGGMKLAEERSGRIFDATGLKPFPSEEGMAALERILLGWDGARCLAVFGDPGRITDFLDRSFSAKSDSGAAGSTRFPDPTGTSFPETLREKVLVYLTDVIARVLKLPARKIDASVNLDDYGIDSLLVNRFNDTVEGVLGPIPKTLLFEYQTLHDLTDYLVRTYPARWSALLEVSDGDAPPIRAVRPPSQGTSPVIASRPREEKTDAPRDGIAVIGMAGRYPQSPDVDTFWRNLRDGIDCISEVPADRWDNRGFYDPDPDKAAEGKIYCKWGGFLEDAYRFDSQFFHIAPRDAELMDPQERIFLETAWHTMEDAGYNRSRWSRFKVGVFVGVTTHSYPLWGPDSWRNGIRNIPASLPWSIANRVSYVFDFQGPSMPVDTACSASLSAVHLACESLRNGECEMALAGGVNLYLHPAKYVQMCQSRMLSPKGRCSSFGADADGFVPGEGVGALLLKPLGMARADGDRIYGVLRGSAVNHGGRTTGYTVPNPRAQATLIEAVLRKAGVDPRRISYVEGHGTGTELGDPVEIRGLVRAYARFTTDRQFCAIGSVKSNIGHLESAAGIAGLSKVLLQMKHRQLVPSLHCQVPNPKINLDETPFFLQRELTAWEPVALDDASADGPPARIATVSSFGAGGANAHVVVEEFQGFEASIAGEEEQRVGPSQLFPLSAKNEDRLRAYARRMAEFFQNPESPVPDTASGIAQIAYTLQTGREAMDVRLAVIAGSVAELREKFLLFAESGTGGDGVYTGHVQEEREKSADLVRGESGRTFLDAILANRELDKIARLWVSGLAVDWDQLHPMPVPRRMSLATYPFAPSRYRLPLETAETGPAESGTEDRPRRIYFAETWQPSAIGPTVGRSRTLLLFETGTDVGDALKQRWDGEVLSVRPGKGYEGSEEGIYDVRPSAEADYRRLLRHLANRTGLPDTIVHFWSRTPTADAPLDFREQLDRILLSFFSLTKALLEQKPERRIHVLFFYPETEGESQPLHSAMGAYAKTLQLENPLVVCKTVSMEPKDASSAADLILAEMRSADDGEIRYRGNRRWRRHWAVFEPEGMEDSGPLLKEDGVYIVTGGAGGLGRIFTDRFTRKVKARFILAGRSAPTEELKERIRLWNRRGSEVVYHSADVTRPADVASLVQETRSRFGRIDGILHAAGTLQDGFLLKKNPDEVMAVIGPKVFGARMLDRATRNDPLDFFVMFSSTTGALGNEGQGDYAYANAYLDGFAAWRESLRKRGERSGRTLSIGWPLWRD
ncbi:MAG: SDR family NAD(P)-dependent oxidoreductase, partial [Desulfobacteraceae bacterium]|nr:SDR family NAD(P)-dependent oxidoreductase [Desulfobacteraceae bacterium]